MMTRTSYDSLSDNKKNNDSLSADKKKRVSPMAEKKKMTRLFYGILSGYGLFNQATKADNYKP